MATINIQATPQTTFWPLQGVQVFAKRNWSDQWQWLPYVVPTQAVETLAPSIGYASFRYDFGRIMRSGTGEWVDWLYYLLNGAYICIVNYNQYGYSVLWVGLVDLTVVTPDGRQDFPSGQQQFVAYALEHLLDRREIFGSYTTDGFIWRNVKFNDGEIGYRSVVEGKDVFGIQSAWSNWQIAQYVIDNYTAGNFQLVGQPEIIGVNTGEVDLSGLTPFQALNRLIDRRRGAAWRIVTDGETGPFYIFVLSTLGQAITDGETVIPANPLQRWVRFASRAVHPEITINSLTMYDEIIVEGDPIVTCFTVSYKDNTLVKGWADELEVEYEAGSEKEEADEGDHDAYRAQDKFASVFQRHMITPLWDWLAGDGAGVSYYNAAPGITVNAGINAALQSNQWLPGKRFLRWIPIREDGPLNNTEYRRPFAMVWVTGDPYGDRFVYIDKLDAVDRRSAQFDVADNGMIIYTRPTANHLFGKGTYSVMSAPSNYEPEVDYRELRATVAVESDGHLSAHMRAPAWYLREVGRTKRIKIPGATLWYILPNTIIDIDNEGNVVYQGFSGNIARNNGHILRRAALLAAQWYGTPRSTVRYTLRRISISDPPGHMISEVVGPEGVTQVGTIVTRRTWRWDRDNETTTVETGFDDLNFGGI